jgi:hypothetical protein
MSASRGSFLFPPFPSSSFSIQHHHHPINNLISFHPIPPIPLFFFFSFSSFLCALLLPGLAPSTFG